ncbi:hypothetical protein, partial [Pseudomonas helleri]
MRTERREVHGHWTLEGVSAVNGHLDAELPPGLQITGVSVAGAAVSAEQSADHLRIPLGACASTGCTVALEWTLSANGWPAEGEGFWLAQGSVWLEARRVMPRLG